MSRAVVLSAILGAAACDTSPLSSEVPDVPVSSVCGHASEREVRALEYSLVDCPAPPEVQDLAECRGLPGRREFVCVGQGRVWLELGPEAQSARRCRLVNPSGRGQWDLTWGELSDGRGECRLVEVQRP